eukprot:scaffold304_cov409-Prasinococcus_capsulatus_cf.AAC.10
MRLRVILLSGLGADKRVQAGARHLMLRQTTSCAVNLKLPVCCAEGFPVPEEQIWQFFIQIAQGLQHLHELRILHRDIKPSNIFLTAEDHLKIGMFEKSYMHVSGTPDFGTYNVTLFDGVGGDHRDAGDLGLGRLLDVHSSYAHTGVGTPLYFSPELCEEKPYNHKSDVWALGCLVYELATGKPPFTASNQVWGTLRRVPRLQNGRCRQTHGLAWAGRPRTAHRRQARPAPAEDILLRT